MPDTINEIQVFASGGVEADGDVLSPADYAADPDTATGHKLGIARRELENTALRQLSRFCNGVAEYIARNYAPGVVDDGDVEKIVAGLEAAVLAAAPGAASTEAPGLVELATTNEAVTGTDAARAVTPAGLLAAMAAVVPGSATTDEQGLVELATENEALAGTDESRAVTPSGVAAAFGQFGLGSPGFSITGWPTASLSDVTGAGNGAYRARSTVADRPSGSDCVVYFALVYNGSGNWNCTQIALDVNSRMYWRSSYGAGTPDAPAWSAWSQVATAIPTYTSGLNAITPAGALTLAHGLPATPTNIVPLLVCQTADCGYSVGDEVHWVFAQWSSASDGISLVADDTNIKIRYGNNGFSVINKSTGLAVVITNASWKLKVIAS